MKHFYTSLKLLLSILIVVGVVTLVKCASANGKIDFVKQSGEKFILKLTNNTILPIGYLGGCNFVGIKIYKISEEGKIPMWYKGKPCTSRLEKKVLWPFQEVEMEFNYNDFKLSSGKYEILVEVDRSIKINSDYWGKKLKPGQISSNILTIN